jgi:general secretion pathway protein H
LELLLVVAIIAVASAGVTLAFRDAGQTQLAREADRLVALFESARARSLASGVPVRWRVTPSGFRFDGLPASALPEQWLSPNVAAPEGSAVVLGPEPIIGPQSVRLVLAGSPVGQGGSSLTVRTDGIRPFAVQADAAPP